MVALVSGSGETGRATLTLRSAATLRSAPQPALLYIARPVSPEPHWLPSWLTAHVVHIRATDYAGWVPTRWQRACLVSVGRRERLKAVIGPVANLAPKYISIHATQCRPRGGPHPAQVVPTTAGCGSPQGDSSTGGPPADSRWMPPELPTSSADGLKVISNPRGRLS